MFTEKTNHKILCVILIAMVLSLSAISTRPVQAAGTVGVCDQASLLAAVSGGGNVTFTCNGTITLTAPIVVATGTSVTIDGLNQKVTISGGNLNRLFTVDSGGSLTLKNLTLTQGSVTGPVHETGFGGAIFSSGELTIDSSTFLNNKSTNGRGGAIFNNSGEVIITNSTFTGNSVTGDTASFLGLGGAVANDNGTLNITNSTFSGNNAPTGGGGAVASRSWSSTIDTVTTFKGTILTASTGSNCASIVVDNPDPTPDGKPITTTDGGGNISYGDTTCPGSNVDPLLSSLADNGGSTQTFALQATSPAINAVTSGCLALDQRKAPRSTTPGCDSGAYEYRAVNPAITVSVSRTDSNTPAYETALTFRATLAPTSTTGTVTFYTDGMPLGTSTLSSGVANLTTSKIPVGSNHVITAVYNGNATDERVTGTLAGGLTVSKAILTVTATNQTSTYGQTDPITFPFTYSDFKNGETSTVINTPPTCSASGTAPRDANTYQISCTGGTDDNYSFTFVNGTLTINKASLAVTANAKSKTYGQSDPTFDFAYGAFQRTDTATVINTAPTCGVSGAHENVDNYTITCSGGVDNNYDFTYTDATLTVNKAILTVKANDIHRKIQTDNPALTYTITGYANNESSEVITGTPVLGTTATVDSEVGSYPITITGVLSAANYDFTFVNGTLFVEPAGKYYIHLPFISRQ